MLRLVLAHKIHSPSFQLNDVIYKRRFKDVSSAKTRYFRYAREEFSVSWLACFLPFAFCFLRYFLNYYMFC